MVTVFSWFPEGGYLAHSLAIMTDAAHLLTDFASMMVSLFSLWISSRPPTKTMNFGWHRSGQNQRSDASVWMDAWREDQREEEQMSCVSAKSHLVEAPPLRDVVFII